MRIIAGEFRGRNLLPPVGEVTRPITDRAKQSLFDVIAPIVEGARVYDCFAGTGSMGLECLSRGAAMVLFYESDRSAVGRLRKNLRTLGVPADRYGIETHDLFKVFDAFAPLTVKEVRFGNLFFLDPPYRFVRERSDDLRRLVTQLHEYMDDPVVVFRHDARDALDLPGLAVADKRTYGGMTVEFLRGAETGMPG